MSIEAGEAVSFDYYFTRKIGIVKSVKRGIYSVDADGLNFTLREEQLKREEITPIQRIEMMTR